MNEDGWLTDPAILFPALAHCFNVSIRQVTLYARHLREGGKRRQMDLFPAIVGGRGSKLQITPRHAAYLFLALATSPAAKTAAEYASEYGDAISQDGPRAIAPGRKLISYIEEVIRRTILIEDVTFLLNDGAVLATSSNIRARKRKESPCDLFFINKDPRTHRIIKGHELDDRPGLFMVSAKAPAELFVEITLSFPAASNGVE